MILSRNKNLSDYDSLLKQEQLIFDVTEKIHEAMQIKCVTRSELADRIGVKREYLTKLLSGEKEITIRTLADICSALDMEPEVYIWGV